jgi:hypothetical protein
MPCFSGLKGDVYALQANEKEECSAAPVAGGLPRRDLEDFGADHPIICAGATVTTCPSTVPVTLNRNAHASGESLGRTTPPLQPAMSAVTRSSAEPAMPQVAICTRLCGVRPQPVALNPCRRE